MEARKGYIGGMNQDTTVNQNLPNSYFSASNLRIITDSGLTTGSLENEKGHLLSFRIPDVAEMTANGETIPAQAGLKIIGAVAMVDTLIIFTTNSDAESPAGTYGQIWVCKYDEATNTIIGLSGEYLDATVHLKYNNQTNFSTAHRIQAKARYETTNIQRVYFTDNYNPVRSFNFAIANPLDFPLELLDLAPNTSFVQPNILSVGSGSLETGCLIQVGFRLLNTDGAISLVSPLSAMIPLPDVDVNSGAFGDFQGTGNSGTRNKSITYEITGIDTNFDVIQHIAVITTGTGTKTAYIFAEESVPDSGEMEVVCSSIDTADSLTITELNTVLSGFSIAKDIEVHGSRLVAANTKTADLELVFDARAYRFNAAASAFLDDATTPITLTGPTPAYDSVPETHDAINLYNDEGDANWYTTNQYKYQVDGVTLGGTGKYVSYKFTTHNMPANTAVLGTTAPDHITNLRYSASSGISLNVTESDDSVRFIGTSNQFQNFASPWAHGHVAGYARGEIYRFGIVFYTKKGNPTFVNWIGDIKFPDVEDGFPLTSGSGTSMELQSLGIEFTIDASSIADQISGYSIVRVKRTDEDCTRLGSGMFMFFDKHEDTWSHSLIHAWEATGPHVNPGPTHPYRLDDEPDINGVPTNSNYHLADKPGHQMNQMNSASSKRVGYILGPMGQLYNVAFKTGDYIRTRGYYGSQCFRYGGDTEAVLEGDRDYAFSFKLTGYLANPFEAERYEIDRTIVAQVGEYFPPSGGFVDGDLGVNGLLNTSYVRESNETPLGMGSKKLMMFLTAANGITHGTGDPGAGVGNVAGIKWLGEHWLYPDAGAAGPNSINFAGGNTSVSSLYFKEIEYARYIANQYGGNTYEARSTNQYMSTGHYQTTETTNLLPFEVFGGDMFVNYFDDEQIEQYWTSPGGANFLDTYNAPTQNKLSMAMCFPVESRINTNFRTGTHWAADKDGANLGGGSDNTFGYPTVWKNQNTTEEKFFAKEFTLDFPEEQPNTIWASDNKINGELIDNWRSFKIANTMEADGVHGPINRLLSDKDRLYFFQDKAVGVASLDDRSVVQDTSGQELILGTGGVFPAFDYISTISGTVHQFSVAATQSDVYYYDARINKIMSLQGGPLTDVHGMASFLRENVAGNITDTDKTLLASVPYGVHTVPDHRYNRVLFTFLNNKQAADISTFLTGGQYVFEDNSYVVQDSITYYIPNAYVSATLPNLSTLADGTENAVAIVYPQSFTLSFNEFTKAFEAFYDYVPGLYLDYGRRLLSVSPIVKGAMFQHNVGTRASYYNRLPVKSTLHTILAEGNSITKIFNNLAYQSNIYDTNGLDIFNETINRIRVYNDYQDTGINDTIVNSTIKRRMRTWHYTIPRDTTDPGNPLARIRNPWARLIMEYDNNANKQFVLHELIYNVSPSIM